MIILAIKGLKTIFEMLLKELNNNVNTTGKNNLIFNENKPDKITKESSEIIVSLIETSTNYEIIKKYFNELTYTIKKFTTNLNDLNKKGNTTYTLNYCYPNSLKILSALKERKKLFKLIELLELKQKSEEKNEILEIPKFKKNKQSFEISEFFNVLPPKSYIQNKSIDVISLDVASANELNGNQYVFIEKNKSTYNVLVTIPTRPFGSIFESKTFNIFASLDD